MRACRTDFAACQSGATAIVVALLAAVLTGFAGLALDVTSWQATRRAMQNAADSAAIGGAVAMVNGDTTSQITAAATTDANLNLSGLSSGAGVAIAINASASTVTATLTKTAPLLLAGLVLNTPPQISVVAVAGAATTGAPVCLLTTGTSGVGINWSSSGGTVSASQCAMVSDSSSAGAVTISGGGVVTSQELCGPGTLSTNLGVTLNPSFSACGAVSDPFANLTAPASASSGTCNYTNYSTNGWGSNYPYTLSPGVYCGGITILGNPVTFSPGLYIIRNGPLLIENGSMTITGTGVTFWFTGSAARLDMTSVSVNMSFSAPTSGADAGILMYQDGSDTTTAANDTITNGSGTLIFDGLLYFGHHQLSVPSQGYNITATQVVANSFTMGGGQNFNLVPASNSVPEQTALSLSSAVLEQ